ncbi:MAG: cobyric acid synthase [Euryarchaeota archaeon]|nr:cobyric acid synthase [Euryarchaeota archaeon]
METKHVLIAGTASHAGKSVIVASLCRLLVNRGYRVAPFKSQNMSLNSWVTREGGEIGIAQAMQAWAARIEPSADMNPILLKPKGEMVSQVIVHGKPIGDRKVREYYDSVDSIFAYVRDSLRALEQEYDVIVMEGAGSPAEINLYDMDIANLRVARYTDAPVILVGDIERGGVFASLYGTLQLLPKNDQNRVKGFIINKFRGEKTLLEPGIQQLEELTGIRVLGVIPYVPVRLPSEDSVSLADKSPAKNKRFDVAVIKLPHISNFTDFEPLESMASVRYVDLGDRVGDPDALIIPGTKNTVDDLRALRRSGMDKQILSCAGRVPILGICGGFQILGMTITDEGIESTEGSNHVMAGLQLLPVDTIFCCLNKETKQVRKLVTGNGPILGSIQNQIVSGYEIHMGSTISPLPIFDDDGAQDATGLVLGTYLHGLFHNDSFLNAFLGCLAERKHRAPLGVRSTLEVRASYELEYLQSDLESDPFDDLAAVLEHNVDLPALYEIIGL